MSHTSRAYAGLALITRSAEAMLCTVGPAGLQASYVSCSVHNRAIYVHVPSSSDHIANLEHATEVIITTPVWQLHGVGSLVPADAPQMTHFSPALLHDIEHLGLTIVRIIPVRMQIDIVEKSHQCDTIEFAFHDM